MELKGNSGVMRVDGLALEQAVIDLKKQGCVAVALERGKGTAEWVVYWRRVERREGQMDLLPT